MKKITFILTFIATVIIAVSCDKIEGPYLQYDDSVETTVDFPDLDMATVYKKVLVEEFTGHRCTNCPDGHQTLVSLSERYGDTLVAIGIHAGTFAIPTSSFPTDFRTEEGNTLYEDFTINLIGTPSAVVNRTQHGGAYALNIPAWQPAIDQELTLECVAAVQLINTFDLSTKKLIAHTKTTPLNGYSGDMQLALYVIEDGIIAPQKDGSETIEDYVHNHVLRGSLNGVYGTILTSAEEDGSYLKSYELDCSQKEWNLGNCSVVAILMDVTNREVLQVEKCPFFNE